MLIKTMKRLFLLYSCAAMILAVRCLAIGPPDAKPIPDRPGTWTYQYLVPDSKEAARQSGMTAAEAAAFKLKLDRIAGAFHCASWPGPTMPRCCGH